MPSDRAVPLQRLNIAILGEGSALLAQALTQTLVPTGTHPQEISVSDQTPYAMAALDKSLTSGALLDSSARQQLQTFSVTLFLEHEQVETENSSEFSNFEVRAMLDRLGIAYSVLFGTQNQREVQAREIIQHVAMRTNQPLIASPSAWCWNCEKCSDASCERLLFSQLIPSNSSVGS